MANSIEKLESSIAEFIKERDWEQFHSPKNLAIGLSVEASELLEIFTWMTNDESAKIDNNKLSMIKDEVGDILIYLTEFCSTMKIDIVDSAFQKLEKNAIKYPISKSKGNSTKYTEFE